MAFGELILILTLIVTHGLFAGSEIAIVALRRSRLKQLVDEGKESAKAVETLQEQPERFIATVQIGLTVVSATAAALGGAHLASEVQPLIETVPILRPYSEGIALSSVVALVSGAMLVIGELVPKSLALRRAEPYALAVGRPLLAISFVMRPVVWLLTAISNLALKPFHDSTNFTETRHSSEELQALVEEAGETGSVDKRVGEIASRALEFGELTAADVMVSRNQIDAIPITAKPEDIKRIFLEEGHSRMPVYADSLDNIVGYVTSKDVLSMILENELIVLQDLIRPAHFVPETAAASQVLQDFQKKKTRIALVVDEHGVVAGLITLEDLVEELFGELFSEHDESEELFKKDGTTAIVRGSASIRDLNRALSLELPEGDSWTTIAGLCSSLAGRIPTAGTKLALEDGTTIEVMEASPRQVRLVRVVPKATTLAAHAE